MYRLAAPHIAHTTHCCPPTPPPTRHAQAAPHPTHASRPPPPHATSTPFLSQDRIGSVGNQFALTTLLGALCVLPVFLLTEGSKLGESMAL